MYFVYIMRCEDESLYTGITNDIARRFLAHQLGRGAKYTRSKKVVSVAYYERKRNRSYALKREAQIKKLPRSKKLVLIASFASRSKS